jgi:hypothetical protein
MTEIEQLTIDVAAAFGQHPSETDLLAFRKKLEDPTLLELTKAWIAKRKSPPRLIPQINGPDLSFDKVKKAFERVASKRAPLIASTLDWPAETKDRKPTTGLETLIYWAHNRHNGIWSCRQRGEKWEGDDYLVDRSWCNLFRELDSTSRLAIQIARRSTNFEAYFREVGVLKIFNEPATYHFLYEAEPNTANWNATACLDILHAALASKKLKKLFRGAYMTGIGEELLYTLDEMLRQRASRVIQSEHTDLYQTVDYLMGFRGFDVFLATQLTLDLNYYLGRSTDGFVVAGPGAQKGAALCFHGPRAWTFAEANEVILLLAKHQDALFRTMFGTDAPRLYGRPISPMNWQNALCETQKYLQKTATEYKGTGGPQQSPVLPSWW